MPLSHIGSVDINTERLLLRAFEERDAEAMYANWCTDPDVTRYLTWQPHKSIEETRDILTRWVAAYSDNIATYNWAICFKPNLLPIGSISIADVSDLHARGEIGYCIGKPWWGMGIMSETLSAVIRFSFEQVGFQRLQAVHSLFNPASGRVMQKVGMQYEGTMRRYSLANDGRKTYDDHLMWAVLRNLV